MLRGSRIAQRAGKVVAENMPDAHTGAREGDVYEYLGANRRCEVNVVSVIEKLDEEGFIHNPRVLGVGGIKLSGGQRQRIALARAMYDNPPIVVLDEPNANLDMAGEAALMTTLMQLQRDGCTVVLVTHRTNVLQAVQKIAMIVGGKLALYGPREEVLATIAQPSPPAVTSRQAGTASLTRVTPAVAGPKP